MRAGKASRRRSRSAPASSFFWARSASPGCGSNGSGGDEFQRETVHAVAEAGRLRPVVEQVAKVPTAAAAQHFGPLKNERSIRTCDDGVRKCAEKARPTRAAFKFGRRAEQWQRAPGANEISSAMLVEQRT